MKYNPLIVIQYFLDCGLPVPVTEYQFDASGVRKFRFDFCWPDKMVALECEGGVWSGGAHGRGSGIVRDIQKYNLAARQGWRVLRCQPRDLCNLETVKMLKECLT